LKRIMMVKITCSHLLARLLTFLVGKETLQGLSTVAQVRATKSLHTFLFQFPFSTITKS